MLDVHDLSCGYGSSVVVRGLDLHVDPGEVVALLGANGAGKTTTLLTIAGVLPVVGGEIRLFGKRINRWPAPASLATVSFRFPTTVVCSRS